MLLILTNRNDLAADYVIIRLLERGLPYFRINSEDVIEADYEINISNMRSELIMTLQGKALRFEDVCSVWFRRQIYPNVEAFIPEGQRSFAVGELLHLVEGILPRSNCRWIDDPERVRFAERKLQQLNMAKELGVPIPETIVSNDSHVLREFASSHETGVVCKPIFRGLYSSGRETRSAYVRRADPSEFVEAMDPRVFPTLLQQLIPKGKDLRITAVGQQLYGVEITTESGQLDWRLPHAVTQYRQITVPPDIATACRSILGQLGLTCGAFDIAVSPEGDWFFLEVNPVGEWAWLDVELDLGIRDTLIDFLYLGGPEC